MITAKAVFVTVVILALAACAGERQSPKQADQFTMATAAYLAKRWSMTPLANGDAQTGSVGGLHAIKQFPTGRTNEGNATPVILTPLAPPPAIQTSIVRSQNYVIGETLSQEIAAELSANLATEGVKVNPHALASALRSMNATFQVLKIQAYLRDIETEIKANAYQNEPIPAGYNGLVIPQGALVIKDLKYDDTQQTTKEGKLALKYLTLFSADVSGSRRAGTTGSMTEAMPVYVAVTLTPVRQAAAPQ